MGIFNKKNNHLTLGGLILSGIALLFSCAPVQRTIALTPKEESTSESSAVEATDEQKQALLSSFVESMTSGVSLSVSQGRLIAGTSQNNVFDFSGAAVKFAIPELSLSKINLAFDGPIVYNSSLKRTIGLKTVDETLYFAVAFPTSTSASDYSGDVLRYKVSLAPYIDANQAPDELTDGDIRYEYGDLDWILDDIIQIVKGDEAEDAQQDSTGAKKVDWEVLSSSLNSIEQSVYDGKPYFTLNLKLSEEGKTYPIGLRGDADFNLSGIDFPAKTQADAPFALSDSISLQLSAEVEGKVTAQQWQAPENTSSYRDLMNSASIFHQIAEMVTTKKFGLDADLSLYHNEAEQKSENGYDFDRAAIDEGLHIVGSANVHLGASGIEALGVDGRFSYLDCEEGNYTESLTQYNEIGVRYNGAETDADRQVYAHWNNVAKIRTNKAVLDQFTGSFDGLKDSLSGQEVDAGDSKLLNGLLSFVTGIKDAYLAVKDGPLGVNLEEKHYEGIASCIDSITVGQDPADENKDAITVHIDLSKIAFSGELNLVLSAAEGMPLARLEFIGASFSYFTISGTASLVDYAWSDLEGQEGYDELLHLPSVSEQLEDIIDSKRAKLSVSGYVLDVPHYDSKEKAWVGKTDTGYTIPGHVNSTSYNPAGFQIDGSFALDLEQRKGSGHATFVDIKEKHVNDHNVKIDVTGPAIEGADSGEFKNILEPSAIEDNKMLFQYDSKNANALNSYASSQNRTNPKKDGGLKGYFTITSLNDIIDLVMDLAGSSDPRFARLTNLITSLLSASLITKLTEGYYFDVLTSPLIKSLSITEEKAVIVLPKALLGLEKDMTIELGFGSEARQDEQGNPVTFRPLQNLLIDTVIGLKQDDDSIKAKELHFEIGIDALNCTDGELCASFGASPNLSSFQDYSTIYDLADYLLGTVTMGACKETDYVTTYHISGTASGKILLSSISLNIDGYIFLRGAEVNILLWVTADKSGLIGSVAISKNSQNQIFYHTDGSDKTGYVMIRHHAWTTKIFGYKTGTENGCKFMKGDVFMDNLLDYLLKYMLCAGSIVANNLDGASSSSDAAVHGEDVITSYACSNDGGSPSFALGIDLAAALNSNLTLTLNPTITTANYVSAYTSGKAMRGISGALHLGLGDFGIDLNLSFSMANLTAREQGGYTYHDAWSDSTYGKANTMNSSGDISSSVAKSIFEEYFYKDGKYTTYAQNHLVEGYDDSNGGM